MSSFDFLFRQPFTMALGWTLVHFLWQGALIALLLGVANASLRRAGSNVRYVTACAALLLMLGAAVTTFLWLGSARASITPVRLLESMAGSSTIAGQAAARSNVPVAPIALVKQWLDGHLASLVLLWFAGVLILSVRTAGGWIV